MTTTSGPRRADIDSFFTCQHPSQFQIDWRAFYESAEQRTDAVRKRWRHQLDIAYGANPRQRLDVYLPEKSDGAAVLLFLHGGGFREGDPALYGFLAEQFVARGVVFATAGYRLTPETYLPETYLDAQAAFTFCREHLESGRVFLAGHSAGAILAAHVGLRLGHLLQGIIPISGVYDFTDYGEFFADASDRAAGSPLFNIVSPPPHTLVAYGSLENRPNYGVDSDRLVTAVRARGAGAELLELAGLDHRQTVEALGDEASPLFQRVARMMDLT
jgi:arylformamidase